MDEIVQKFARKTHHCPTDRDIRTVQAAYLSKGTEDDTLDLLINGTTSSNYGILLRKADSKKSVLIMEIT